MTDTPASPTDDALAAARALVAEDDARIARERQTKADAADKAVRDLVGSDVFKQAHAAFEATLEAAPRSVEVQYAVTMMDRMLAANPPA